MPLGENLRSAIGILNQALRVLPAAGGAIEYLQRPDAEEVDDERINSGVDHVDEFAETEPPSSPATNISVPPKLRGERHLFRYFLDGSLRTYFLGTGLERGRSFPIMLAQIGASCVNRRDGGQGIIPCCFLRSRTSLCAWIRPVTKPRSRRSFSYRSSPW